MKASEFVNASWLAFGAAALLTLSGVGCQTNFGGQALPSAYYLQDDVQYFPAGPQDKLYNERRALEQYKAGVLAEQQAAQPAGPPGPGPGAGPPPVGQPAP